MRFACLLPAALLATGCGVPDVTFAPDSGRDATRDAVLDVPGDDQSADVEASDAADSGDAGDAAQDAFEPCKGDAGPPGGFHCCQGVSGVVCGSNMCTQTACMQCATISCAWPNVCCEVMGGSATCKPAGGC
ncbi:MAG TPA: hypothetical protein VF765_16690 [Polyangiaceae bacterium]